MGAVDISHHTPYSDRENWEVSVDQPQASVYPAPFIAEAHMLGTMLKMRCAMVYGCPFELCIGLRHQQVTGSFTIVVFHPPQETPPLELEITPAIMRRLMAHDPMVEVFDPEWLGRVAVRQALTWHDRAHQDWMHKGVQERVN